MVANGTDVRADARDSITTDDILRGLINIRRRRILFHLRQSGSATVDELLDVLVTDLTGDQNDADRSSFEAVLYHIDFPKLESLDLIEFNEGEGIVRLTVEPTELGEWLDLAVQTDLRMELGESEADEPDAETVRTLVVDDNSELTEVIDDYFASNVDDISVTTATRVEDAVSMLRDQSFDCIVSDLRMPVISGLDFLEVVRKEDSEIPFLLFTARGSEEVASEAIERDVTGYVIKTGEPEQFEVLADQIRTAVSQT